MLVKNTSDYILVLKDNTRPNRNIRVAFGKSPIPGLSRGFLPFTGFCTEGPAVLKRQLLADLLMPTAKKYMVP
ncbi:MAG: hypothetical protein MZV63_58035 [Marinilabiliales bacterium]|nr:hypothetical protein [Marinilabiliales bacterium]